MFGFFLTAYWQQSGANSGLKNLLAFLSPGDYGLFVVRIMIFFGGT
jgi:hypothetical protein